MKTILWFLIIICFTFSYTGASTEYHRNQAVPVQQVLFGKVESVRKITEQEIVEDKADGWKVFGGALVGGLIGNQFGDGSGQVAAAFLGAIIGGKIAEQNNRGYRERTIELIEMMILTENDGEFMVIQDIDEQMSFSTGDRVRLVYLKNGTVRVDLQM